MSKNGPKTRKIARFGGAFSKKELIKFFWKLVKFMLYMYVYIKNQKQTDEFTEESGWMSSGGSVNVYYV